MAARRENLSYRSIKKIVLDRIQNRTWAPDSLLPSEVELASEFSSTRTTVNRALRELAEEGYIERKRKAGTRVLQSPVRRAQFEIPLVRDEIIASGAAYKYSLVERTVQRAPEWLVARLNLAGAQSVLHVKCIHYSDNTPFQYEDRWIVTASVKDVLEADFSKVSPGEWLVETVPFTDMRLSFMATKADRKMADFLDTTIDDPVFTVERATWLRGEPITLAKMYFGSGYQMTTYL